VNFSIWLIVALVLLPVLDLCVGMAVSGAIPPFAKDVIAVIAGGVALAVLLALRALGRR
jgi:hypothetical protein